MPGRILKSPAKARALPVSKRKKTTVTATDTASSPETKKSSTRVTSRKAPAKAASVKAKAAKKAAAPVSEKPAPVPRERDEYGITVGTDQSRVLAQMIQGGTTKHDVVLRCDKMFEGETTTGGKKKPTSTIVNQLLRAMLPRGFRIESTWRVVAPEPGSLAKPPVKRVVRKAVTKKADETTPEAPATKTVKPRVLKSAKPRTMPKSKRSKASV